MSYYEGLAFFLCLIGVLLIAAVLGYLEKPLKWFSFVVSLLFVAGVFWGSWLNFLYLVLFYVWSLVLILGYFSIRQKGGRKEGIYHVFVLLSLVPLVICKVSPLLHMSLFGFIGISYPVSGRLEARAETRGVHGAVRYRYLEAAARRGI